MLYSRCLLHCSLALLSILLGTANFAIAGTITSVVPTPPYYYGGHLNPPGPSANGADFVNAFVDSAYGRNDVYGGNYGFWSQSGSFAGRFSNSEYTVSLNGDSRSQAIQITNIGTAYLYWLDINMAVSNNPSVVFDTSSRLAYGSTTDSMNGVVEYFQPQYVIGQSQPSSTPYFAELFIQFDKPGLSPGASATIFADADVVTPEPGTAALMGAALMLLALQMRRTRRSLQQR